jgi:hypothetical protein
MLYPWFAILYKLIPQKITITKTTALGMACCKLHNFCSNNNDTNAPIPREGDMLNIALEGGIPLDAAQDYRPFQLLNGGYHNLDFDCRMEQRRNEYRQYANSHRLLPRDLLHNQIIEHNLRRATPEAREIILFNIN